MGDIAPTSTAKSSTRASRFLWVTNGRTAVSISATPVPPYAKRQAVYKTALPFWNCSASYAHIFQGVYQSPLQRVTLSTRGIEPLWLRTVLHLRARRTRTSDVSPSAGQKMPAFFEGLVIPFDTALSDTLLPFNKQFFRYRRVHQTFRRPRLRRFLPLIIALNQPTKNGLPVFHVGGMLLSVRHTQCAAFDCKKFDAPHSRLAQGDILSLAAKRLKPDLRANATHGSSAACLQACSAVTDGRFRLPPKKKDSARPRFSGALQSFSIGYAFLFAASTVCFSSTEVVTAPTPPGTGVNCSTTSPAAG